ncbi:MAG: SMP-30/gluconolactonase/LRE family protein, partial [Bryobacteraceae bacterium]
MPRTPSPTNPPFARRSFLGLAAAAVPWFSQTATGQTPRDWTNRNPLRYPDPDVVAIDPSFAKYQVFNAVLYRHYVGTRWAEGPAWSGEGNYVVWSDIPNNRQMRLLQEDNHVAVFRSPSGYSNGNTFDFEGRQISCEHAGRRVARYEHNGHVTVLAERYNGKPLNSPNDVVVHPDGGVWFSDPPYGILGNYEGFQATPELKEAFYRIDPHTAHIDLVSDEFDKPNGLCFSPDYKKLYLCDTGAPKNVQVCDVDG